MTSGEMQSYIQNTLLDSMQYFLDKPNTKQTRSQIIDCAHQFMNSALDSRDIEQFKIVCDESNNSPMTIKDNMILCDIYIQPVRSVDIIFVEISIPAYTSTLMLSSDILTKEDNYAAYDRAMSIIIGKR